MIANHPLPAAHGSKPIGPAMGCTILSRRDARLFRFSRACGQLGDSFKLARVNPQKRRAIFERLRSANPNPATELEYSTPFELLVAVVLSAQATDKGVNLATRKLFAVANTPQAMLALGQEGLEHYIKTIGLYRTKAKNLLATCRILTECHGGEVPRSREALQTLPGVGRKTANVVLNTAFGASTIAVDTHIFRVANRTGLAPGVDVLEVERRLEKFTPDEFKRNAHHWLILHGRYVCVARRPKCPECIIRELCEYRAKTVAQPASHAA
jgi:endonuclease III